MAKAVYALGLLTSETTRFRLKAHNGTDMENRYQLRGYGIPEDQLPLTSSGKVKPQKVHQWINIRATIERKRMEEGVFTMGQDDTSIIECPRLNDVAMRPGKSYLCHPGNVRFKELLDKYMHEHAAADRRGKDKISWGIIDEIEQWGGRFLEWDNVACFWVQNKDRNNVRTKIPVYFRDHKRNTRGKRRKEKQLLNEMASASMDVTNPLRFHEKKRRLFIDKNIDTSCLCWT
ncbi:unnamed protein product [Pseudo-nitzschia multistriata]|uniref:DUF6824 domain-containing protein n=1 Tax=Pseudo-nitzschia multistriata TaxID=183589 RepID=A0A448ZGV6_9STRA|nr:unnamed protein product [Pseudo-nitzschia multistriata]